MERMTIKKFEEESNIEIIENLMNINNGYVTTKLISDLGIHRMYLNIMKKRGMIEKVGTGIYIASNKIEDSYYIFSLELSNIIYSHMTALYFHGLSIKAPSDNYAIAFKKHNIQNKFFNKV